MNIDQIKLQISQAREVLRQFPSDQQEILRNGAEYVDVVKVTVSQLSCLEHDLLAAANTLSVYQEAIAHVYGVDRLGELSEQVDNALREVESVHLVWQDVMLEIDNNKQKSNEKGFEADGKQANCRPTNFE